MTTDIRTAAQREAERQNELHPESPSQDLENAAFVAGAAWGAARVTPTREQIADAVKTDERLCYPDGGPVNWNVTIDAVLALMAGLAEGEAR